MSTQRIIVGLGELLWDLLPEGSRLGGAPANFAVMAGRLGSHAIIASRLGADPLGAEARALLEVTPVDTSLIQTDPELPTGTVSVSLEGGDAHYTFPEPVAWDRLTLTPEWRDLAGRADAVCFGTLAQRDPYSRETIQAFLDVTRPDCVRIFDVNLRPPFWSAEVLRGSLERATILKLNAGELPLVLASASVKATSLEDDDAITAAVRQLLDQYPLQLVCVTLGGRGSLLVTRDQVHRHPGQAAVVRDTVGAGDAFTAALAHYYLEGAPLAVLSEAGNRWGAWVASQSGGMPPLPADVLEATAAELRRHSANLSS